MNVHIVFGTSGPCNLTEALRQFNPPGKWRIISLPDLFSIGPVWQLDNKAGFRNRLQWVKINLLQHKTLPYFSAEEYESSLRTSVQELKNLEKRKAITVWIGENAHEQTGLRYVCSLLNGKENNLQVINVSNAFQKHYNPDNRFRYCPYHLGEVNPDELVLLLGKSQLFQSLSDSNRNQLIQEWDSLSHSSDLLRIWKNGKIKSVGENYFDKLIIRSARKIHKQKRSGDFIKAARIIGEVLGHIDQVVGDEFLEYRIIQLIKREIFLYQGSLDAMRNFSVKLKLTEN